MNAITKAGIQSSTSPFTFVLSTGDVDRMGDVVMQNGINLTAFKKNPVALLGHSQRSPIGTWENIRREGDQLLADLKLATRGTSRMIDEVRSLIEQRILRAASIGFGVNKSEPLDPEKPYDGVRYTKTDLLEASVVAVPANPNALALRSLSPETRALLNASADGHLSMTEDGHALTIRAAPAAMRHASTPQRGNRMNLSQRIEAGRARLVEIDKRVGELQAVAEQVDVISDDHTSEIEALTGERDTVEKNIANLEKLEDLIKRRAEPVTNASAAVIQHRSRPALNDDEPKGTLVARIALAHVFAHVERRPISDIVRERFGHDQRVEAVFKSTVPVADTTTGGWAKELVRTDIQGFIDMLAPVSAYASLAPRGFVINFGDAGSVSIPYRAGTLTDLAGAFVGENGVIPVKRGTLGAMTLNRYKMGVISTLTKELTRASTPQAEALIRRFMSDDTAVALDYAFLGAGAAVAGVRPAGILNGVAAIPASVLPAAVDKALADLKALINALVAANLGVRPVFLMNPSQKLSLSLMYSGGIFLFRDELAAGRLMGVEVVTSTNVPAGDVIIIDAAQLATGLGTPEFDASDTATLVMANADAIAPTQATDLVDSTIVGTAEQVPPDGGLKVRSSVQSAAGKVGENAQAISLFQSWAIALRTVLPISWGITRAGSVAWVDNVGW